MRRTSTPDAISQPAQSGPWAQENASRVSKTMCTAVTRKPRLQRRKPAAPFALKPFVGDGLSPEFADAGWESIRAELYRDRG